MLKPILGAAILLVVLTLCVDYGSETNNEFTATPDMRAVEDHFNGPEENIITGGIWTGAGHFKVGAVDDGTRRDGLARYVCQALADRGFEKVNVEVFDHHEMVFNKKRKVIGAAWCPDWVGI